MSSSPGMRTHQRSKALVDNPFKNDDKMNQVSLVKVMDPSKQMKFSMTHSESQKLQMSIKQGMMQNMMKKPGLSSTTGFKRSRADCKSMIQ